MTNIYPIRTAGLLALAISGLVASAGQTRAETELCVDCLSVRVGPPMVVRGPFPDELDATFSAIRLGNGSFRGFSANGATYAIDGTSLSDLGGPRRAVLHPGETGSSGECGNWLTSTLQTGDALLGFVHQERNCDYSQGHTHKSMAIATSADEGLTWTSPETVITGRDSPQHGRITGEGDCSMIDGQDGYLYAYCLRNSDWQTIAARAPIDNFQNWRKYFEGGWDQPGLGGEASAIGYLGPGAAFFPTHGWVATITADPWFSGLRLSLSSDKVTFTDLREPLVPIDGLEWQRPADSALLAYVTMINPENGSNSLTNDFVLSYTYVPRGEGFSSRYLVHRNVSLELAEEPMPAQTGVALTRWVDPERQGYVTSTGPLTGDRTDYLEDAIVAYMLTRAPETAASVKYAECSRDMSGRIEQVLAADGTCEAQGYVRERTSGWLFASQQTGTLPVYRCTVRDTGSRFASNAPDCEGLGQVETILGYGLAP